MFTSVIHKVYVNLPQIAFLSVHSLFYVLSSGELCKMTEYKQYIEYGSKFIIFFFVKYLSVKVEMYYNRVCTKT
jgi:hypothetical protein